MQPALKKVRRTKGNDPDTKAMLRKLKADLDYLHSGFDTVTDPVMIDSLIYEIMSVNMKYKFFLDKCRAESNIDQGGSMWVPNR